MANLRFIVSLTTKDNDYQLEQAASAQAAALKVGVDAQILYADSDAITQSTQLLKAIQSDAAMRPHAIVFEPVGGTAFPQVAQAAVSAKIGWAALNREADYIQGPSENSAAQDRTEGMQMAVPHNVQIISLRGRWTEESAQRAVESWLRLNTSNKTQIDVVGAQNDLMAMGARKAFEDVTNIADREKWLRLPFTGVDGLVKTGQAWVRGGTLAATVMVPTNAGQAISMMVEALKTGKDVAQRTLTVPESLPGIEKLAAKGEKGTPIA